MSRRPATVTQADVARIVRAAKQAGAAEVEVRIGGTATIRGTRWQHSMCLEQQRRTTKSRAAACGNIA